MDSLLEKEMRLEQLMPLMKEYLATGRSVKFSPRGISMLPMLRQGKDSVLLSPLPEKLKKYDLPLNTLCILKRGEENVIREIPARDAVMMLLQQSNRPAQALISKQMDLLDKLSASVKFYKLACNMDPQIALVSYKTMARRKVK